MKYLLFTIVFFVAGVSSYAKNVDFLLPIEFDERDRHFFTSIELKMRSKVQSIFAKNILKKSGDWKPLNSFWPANSVNSIRMNQIVQESFSNANSMDELKSASSIGVYSMFVCTIQKHMFLYVNYLNSKDEIEFSVLELPVFPTNRKSWFKTQKNVNQATSLFQKLLDTMQRIQVNEMPAQKSTLKLSLGTRDSEQSQCLKRKIRYEIGRLTQLVGEASISSDLKVIQKSLGIQGTPVRSNFRLNMFESSARVEGESKFWNFNFDASEGVFGSPLRRLKIADLKVAFNSNEKAPWKIDFSILKTRFETEAERIGSLNSIPKIIYQYGAWVYLDRGRAYGLKINDRLLIGLDGKTKGHVIGFFGPEAGLKNQENLQIHEGAIVFIRTGLDKVKIGQSVAFDPQSFPAELSF